MKKLLRQFLVDMKSEIEADGLIATIDEAITRLDDWSEYEK